MIFKGVSMKSQKGFTLVHQLLFILAGLAIVGVVGVSWIHYYNARKSNPAKAQQQQVQGVQAIVSLQQQVTNLIERLAEAEKQVSNLQSRTNASASASATTTIVTEVPKTPGSNQDYLKEIKSTEMGGNIAIMEMLRRLEESKSRTSQPSTSASKSATKNSEAVEALTDDIADLERKLEKDKFDLQECRRISREANNEHSRRFAEMGVRANLDAIGEKERRLKQKRAELEKLTP